MDSHSVRCHCMSLFKSNKLTRDGISSLKRFTHYEVVRIQRYKHQRIDNELHDGKREFVKFKIKFKKNVISPRNNQILIM